MKALWIDNHAEMKLDEMWGVVSLLKFQIYVMDLKNFFGMEKWYKWMELLGTKTDLLKMW